MKKNGYTKTELLIFIGIFTIIYFVIANKVSYVFNHDYNADMYALTMDSIETKAEIYGKYKKDLFKDKSSAYITVDDLAKENFVTTDDKGEVEDPRDSSKSLNDLKIKLINKDDVIKAKILG